MHLAKNSLTLDDRQEVVQFIIILMNSKSYLI